MTAVIIACTSCATGGDSDKDKFKHKGGKVDPYVKMEVKIGSGPTGTSGTLGVPITQFSSGDNGQSCFPYTQGWKMYYVTFYFLGPNVSPLPNPNNYPNPDQVASVTVHTKDDANGTTLDTGVVILNNSNPGNKICNDDASPSWANNAKLSSATFAPTGTGKKYRTAIYFKDGTQGNLTEIKVHWSYP